MGIALNIVDIESQDSDFWFSVIDTQWYIHELELFEKGNCCRCWYETSDLADLRKQKAACVDKSLFMLWRKLLYIGQELNYLIKKFPCAGDWV